ncbi:glycosyltransferase family protein [Aeromonas rivipollensis]|uniref:hypothetical protein n=1 Tax=Aeromonas rivipollensis TaxID=948519 RepID=UPI00372D859B
MEDKILVVFVLYKENFFDCVSYKTFSLDELGGINTVYIYDNSPEPHCDEDLLRFKNLGFEYVHDYKNPGVSQAYNTAAIYAKKNGYSWILILDQDTNYKTVSLSKYREAMVMVQNNTSVAVITPLLFNSRGQINSPAKNYYGRYFPVGNKFRGGLLNIRHYSCMNSGLLIKTTSFEEVSGYDSSLFYFSDHDFFYRLGLLRKNMYVSQVVASHEASSGSNALCEEDLLKRFYFVVRDGKKFSRKVDFFHKIGTYSIILTRLLKLILITRTLKPLSIFVNG